MNLDELRTKPHLSASSIRDYIECGLLYKLSRVDKLPPAFKSDALVFGNAMHKAVADFNQNRIEGRLLPVNEFQAAFTGYWAAAAKDNQGIRYKNGNTYQSLLEQGKNLLEVYHQNFNTKDDEFTVLAIEEPFLMSVEGVAVPMIGAMDLVEVDSQGTLIVSDFKTASKAYSVDEVQRNFQMTMYHMATKSNGYAGKEILLRFDCLVKTKKPKFEQYYTSRSDADEKRTVKKIQKVWEGISKGVFIPNDMGWRCVDCAYRVYCDEYLQN